MTRDRSDPRHWPLISYAQCWEDADVLVEGLNVAPGQVCLSIASAGDNTLALLLGDPARVVAVDANPSQIACLALRMAAFRTLDHDELLELIGSRPSRRRRTLYRRCRTALPDDVRAFWDARPSLVDRGIGEAGRLERFFRIFRARVLPLVHSRARVAQLLDTSAQDRTGFYETTWNTWRWRTLFRIFFSRRVIAALGRRRRSFRFVRTPVARELLARTERALGRQDPSVNPYLHWILTGRHGDALPMYLRREHFEQIRARVDRIELHAGTLDDVLAASDMTFDRFNLSDIFEYMSEDEFRRSLERLLERAAPGARLMYWNLFVPRARPASLDDRLQPLAHEAGELGARDCVFFYGRVVLEEVLA